MKRIRIEEPERVDRFMKTFSSAHSEDFKAAALKLLAANHSVEEVSALLGVAGSTLYHWVEEWNKKKSLA